jgi:RNA polymerase primary sigma factor
MNERKDIEEGGAAKFCDDEQEIVSDNRSGANYVSSADEIDSLSKYMSDLNETELLSPQEELQLFKKYHQAMDEVWENLCSLGFVANEYLNLLEDISVEGINRHFMIAGGHAGAYMRKEPLLLIFSKWKAEINKFYDALRQADNSTACAAKTDEKRASLVSCLKKFRPQNSLLEEWVDAALEYNNCFKKNISDAKEKKREYDYIQGRILMSKSKFDKIISRIVLKREEADLACQTILEANLRLVISVAKNFQKRGLSLGDLIQEGNLGMMKALKKFDYRMGHKFSTYAMWWIKQSVSRALAEQSRTIRIPVHILSTLHRMNSEEEKFILEKGKMPSPEELATALDMPKERIRALKRMASQPISLQAPIGEDEDASLLNFLPDENSDDPIQKAALSLLKEKISKVMSAITEREKQVINMRFGFHSEEEKTLDEIAKYFGISKERVRQIEYKALQKLRQPEFRKLLEGYY